MADMSLLVLAAETTPDPYWPNIAGNAVGALIGGLIAWAIAWWVAQREVEQAKKAREEEQQERGKQEQRERAEREARDEAARAERRARDEQERLDRRARDDRERAERAEREEQERRGARQRSVLLSFVEACGGLLTALQEGDNEPIRVQMLWAEGRAAQVRMLLHSEGKDELLAWFHAQWAKPTTKTATKLTNPRTVAWNLPMNRLVAKTLNDEIMLIEHVCARWSTQPISEWTTDLPPAWLLSGGQPPAPADSEDGGHASDQ